MITKNLETVWHPPDQADKAQYSPREVFKAGLRNHHIANTAYPIAHQKTFKSYQVSKSEIKQTAIRGLKGHQNMGLYIHVPFCETRCSFCEYTVVGNKENNQTDAYINALIKELSYYDEALPLGQQNFRGMDIGGGTPSFLSISELERVMKAVQISCHFSDDSDISIETTPKIAAKDPQKLLSYYQLGIKRISMGIQVIQPDLLKVLNRDENGINHHFQAVENIRAAGFERFNIDLMFGFKGQTLESWQKTLEHTIALNPEYITLYRMRYKLTRISHQASHVNLKQIREMNDLSKSLLKAAGYFANPGKTTWSKIPGDVGTSSYLAHRVQNGIPYLGLGLGAQTFTDTTIAYNKGAAGKNLGPYLKSIKNKELPIQDLYDLPIRHMMGKMCAVSFYFGEILRAPFYHKFGISLEQAFPEEIDFLISRGLMVLSKEALSLTPEGSHYKNGIIPLFAAPSIQKYLIDRDPLSADDMKINRQFAIQTSN